MKVRLTSLILLMLFFVSDRAHAQPWTVTDPNNDNVAVYTVTFTSSWSEQSHPGLPTNAHFSPLIGATHNVSTTLWMSGVVASPGIEQMAETGGTTILRNEMTAVGANVYEIFSGPGLATSPGQVAIPVVTADRSHAFVTLVTMIAPSPDWFVGVYDLSLLDAEGQWQDTLVVTLYPYDAGTDAGTDYTSPDQEPTQHSAITLLSGQTPFSDAPIGSLTLTRLHRLYLPTITGTG